MAKIPAWTLPTPKAAGEAYDEVQLRELVVRFPRDAEPGATVVYERFRGGVVVGPREPAVAALTPELVAAIQKWAGALATGVLIDATATATLADPVQPVEAPAPVPLAGGALQ